MPAPGGGIQTVVAREDSWPAADVFAFRNYGSANDRILSGGVIARDGHSSIENRGSPPDGGTLQNPTQQAPASNVSELTGISDRIKPIRYLGHTDINVPSASVFDAGAPTAQFVLPDQLNAGGGRADWAAALAGLGPLRPMQAAPPPQAGGVPGTTSTVPVRILSRVSADKPQASLFDTSAPAVPLVPASEVFSSDRRNAFASGSDASSLAGGAGGSSMPDPQGSSASILLEYIRHLNQLSANNPRVSVFDPGAPATPPAPSDDSIPMGGLAGRVAALTGFDPDNPDAPPPGGLLKLLLAAQQR